MALREVPSQLLFERAESAVAGLLVRGVELGDAPARWRGSMRGVRVFEDDKGNAVRHRPGGRIELRGDHRAIARGLFEAHGPALKASRAPITIEGMDPPWLALGMLEITPGPGYSPGIRLLQADPMELLDGLSLADATPLIEADRVEWFVGPDAAQRLAASIAGEIGVAHEGPVVQLQSLRTPIGPGLGAAIRSAVSGHARAHTGRIATIRRRDAAATDAQRLDRLARPDGPLSIALIAGRFTTVLRPMIEDLAQAFGARGHRTRIITEPGDHRTLTPSAYSHAFAEFDPDLIVAANHTREDMDRLLGERVMPSSVPWVTWVQDAMPHLLRPRAGASIGPCDLAVGHIGRAMLDRFGYPADRAVHMPMVASDRKFDPARADADLVRELACEAAAFTNHSETPERMRARLIDEVSASPHAAAIVDRIADRVAALAERPASRVPANRACREIVDELAQGADAETRENLVENVALRLYDRACRHAALHWASRVCRRRGWRFSIFGAGWPDHPTLGEHARGTLNHGTELCSAYAAARVSIDVTAMSMLHQRIAECTLAGGLPVTLVFGDACTIARARLRYTLTTELVSECVPVAHEPGKVAFPAYRVPEADRFLRLGALTGLRGYPYAVVRARPVPCGASQIDADQAVGLLERGFTDEASLERIIERAGDPDWRSRQRGRTLGVIRDRCTHDALADAIFDRFAALAAGQTAAA